MVCCLSRVFTFACVHHRACSMVPDVLVTVASFMERDDLNTLFSCSRTTKDLNDDVELRARWLLRRHGARAIWMATVFGSAELVLRLSSGPDKNGVDEIGRTVLHVAGAKGHDRVVALLLNVPGLDAMVDDEGRTALHVACVWGNAGDLTQLLASCLAGEMRGIMQKMHTTLAEANVDGHLAVVDLLLAGRDVNAVDKKGFTALRLACAWERFNPMDLFKRHS